MYHYGITQDILVCGTQVLVVSIMIALLFLLVVYYPLQTMDQVVILILISRYEGKSAHTAHGKKKGYNMYV